MDDDDGNDKRLGRHRRHQVHLLYDRRRERCARARVVVVELCRKHILRAQRTFVLAIALLHARTHNKHTHAHTGGVDNKQRRDVARLVVQLGADRHRLAISNVFGQQDVLVIGHRQSGCRPDHVHERDARRRRAAGVHQIRRAFAFALFACVMRVCSACYPRQPCWCWGCVLRLAGICVCCAWPRPARHNTAKQHTKKNTNAGAARDHVQGL